MTLEHEDERQCSVWSTHISWPPRKRLSYGEIQEGNEIYEVKLISKGFD
ncbi:hypothetical protein AB3N60_18560 [Leptospira sp. WS39.C2]